MSRSRASLWSIPAMIAVLWVASNSEASPESWTGTLREFS